MRHRRTGRKLGRNPKHQRALLRNLASALFLTELTEATVMRRRLMAGFDLEASKAKVPGRIVTTLEKAKEVRPLVERCITIAKHSSEAAALAAPFGTTAKRNSQEWKAWRNGPNYPKWREAIAPVVTAKRRVVQLIGDKQAMRVLFETIAPRFQDRNGGYTRVVRLAKPRLGDAGTRALIEFVGTRDRVTKKSTKPVFESSAAAK